VAAQPISVPATRGRPARCRPHPANRLSHRKVWCNRDTIAQRDTTRSRARRHGTQRVGRSDYCLYRDEETGCPHSACDSPAEKNDPAGRARHSRVLLLPLLTTHSWQAPQFRIPHPPPLAPTHRRGSPHGYPIGLTVSASLPAAIATPLDPLYLPPPHLRAPAPKASLLQPENQAGEPVRAGLARTEKYRLTQLLQVKSSEQRGRKPYNPATCPTTHHPLYPSCASWQSKEFTRSQQPLQVAKYVRLPPIQSKGCRTRCTVG
jgi:hypothetical protein